MILPPLVFPGLTIENRVVVVVGWKLWCHPHAHFEEKKADDNEGIGELGIELGFLLTGEKAPGVTAFLADFLIDLHLDFKSF